MPVICINFTQWTVEFNMYANVRWLQRSLGILLHSNINDVVIITNAFCLHYILILKISLSRYTLLLTIKN